ncbi:YceD family protein [Albibacillus kandeliae]|uniref:YceD family protein n=1 Tax=Albibacillus kandeliae TaxID=2174228 RepID=UPI000D68C04F|nr:DUF177 domain-containing protein [Albibacillus kandeliae]
MPTTQPFRVADLAQNRSTPFELRPDAAELSALAEELGLLGLRKLSFSGQIAGQGRRDWVLTGQLGATVVQPCVVTLEPVTTRIDTEVTRTYLAEMPEPEGEEVEMPEDDTQEQLGSVIDPGQVMVEALALALPLYPRKEGVGSGDASFAGPGITPMTDEEAKPFAGLAALRDSLKKEE